MKNKLGLNISLLLKKIEKEDICKFISKEILSNYNECNSICENKLKEMNNVKDLFEQSYRGKDFLEESIINISKILIEKKLEKFKEENEVVEIKEREIENEFLNKLMNLIKELDKSNKEKFSLIKNEGKTILQLNNIFNIDLYLVEKFNKKEYYNYLYKEFLNEIQKSIYNNILNTFIEINKEKLEVITKLRIERNSIKNGFEFAYLKRRSEEMNSIGSLKRINVKLKRVSRKGKNKPAYKKFIEIMKSYGYDDKKIEDLKEINKENNLLFLIQYKKLNKKQKEMLLRKNTNKIIKEVNDLDKKS